jgi:hypothetical protein
MQHVDDACKPHRVDGSMSVAVMVLNHLQDTRAAKALERLCGRMFVAALRKVKCVADAP